MAPTTPTAAAVLDLSASGAQLTAALVDIESVSGAEAELADAIEHALRNAGSDVSQLQVSQAEPSQPDVSQSDVSQPDVSQPDVSQLQVSRLGNVVIARTEGGRTQRVILAGHLDTVPVAGNLPSQVREGRLYGCGTSDMKSGVALQLRIAHLIATHQLVPAVDVTWFFYDCEEVTADRNGLNQVAAQRPDLLAADLAILLEPTNGGVEGGCQGTLRAVVSTTGTRAHAARSWLGANAIHAAAEVLNRLVEHQAAQVEVDGLLYREGLNAVFIDGGSAGNVVPDSCRVTVNYRFAPDKSEQQALEHVQRIFLGFAVELIDSAPAARPGLDRPLAQALVAALGGRVGAKLGWTDVARFSALGIPAVNFGPGDPNLAHTREESVELTAIQDAEDALVAFLAG